VAILYDDAFQLLVPVDSAAHKMVDLRGKRIALAQTGGQFQSFLRVAEHFGLHEADFQFVGKTEAESDRVFLSGGADAIFRVRAIGNPSIRQLVQTGKVRFLPIDHAAAMRIDHPAFQRRSFRKARTWAIHRCPRRICPQSRSIELSWRVIARMPRQSVP
jgi:hypothetical protein